MLCNNFKMAEVRLWWLQWMENIIKIVPCVEGDRSDCQPEVSSKLYCPKPKAEGSGGWSRVDSLICHPQQRAWLFLSHRKSIIHSPCLSLYFRPICKTQRIEHELLHGFSNNSLPCKQMTTFSLLLLVSTQLVSVPLLLQNEFAAKYR